MTTSYKVSVQHIIPAGRVSDLLVGAFEGGSNYWCHSAKLISSSVPKINGEVWYGQEAIFEGEYSFTLEFDSAAGEEEINQVLYSEQDIQRALAIFAEKYPANFADFLNENDDAATADLFLQCLCFGEETFS